LPLGQLYVSQLHIGEGEAVHGLRVLGIVLVGAAQVIESLQAAALLAEVDAQVLEGHRILGSAARARLVKALAWARLPFFWQASLRPRGRASTAERSWGSGILGQFISPPVGKPG